MKRFVSLLLALCLLSVLCIGAPAETADDTAAPETGWSRGSMAMTVPLTLECTGLEI